jgi:hypothetical protein
MERFAARCASEQYACGDSAQQTEKGEMDFRIQATRENMLLEMRSPVDASGAVPQK